MRNKSIILILIFTSAYFYLPSPAFSLRPRASSEKAGGAGSAGAENRQVRQKVESFLEQLKSEDEYFRAAAVRNLGALEDLRRDPGLAREVVWLLGPVSSGDPSDTVRIAAIRAIGALAILNPVAINDEFENIYFIRPLGRPEAGVPVKTRILETVRQVRSARQPSAHLQDRAKGVLGDLFYTCKDDQMRLLVIDVMGDFGFAKAEGAGHMQVGICEELQDIARHETTDEHFSDSPKASPSKFSWQVRRRAVSVVVDIYQRSAELLAQDLKAGGPISESSLKNFRDLRKLFPEEAARLLFPILVWEGELAHEDAEAREFVLEAVRGIDRIYRNFLTVLDLMHSYKIKITPPVQTDKIRASASRLASFFLYGQGQSRARQHPDTNKILLRMIIEFGDFETIEWGRL
ncbi:MAG: HEAT repeat domain-containing protein, partial [Candidatus Omnitrophica bacterium]|nr:HEAT repeat domain-containing protein [Candidatus Omnitrophota bacterium]